ncbi:hypothetical protein A3F65_03480 [Candidatus Saccharibacteria bacterium RIFCSPHIGHO2_12_FULL_47_16b]|nr:MAG: hypothetical protein A3F65_03480 [Candidatus Saccharibacteria bacterium RIFCSPHIGHO2_12_FULL_47_16b]OGL40617.1 MAG: hypothetical protein A3J32_00480 [Candidatus Saccharibacteria bacterium RIFCSPLOWO2_02_FULL_46_7]
MVKQSSKKDETTSTDDQSAASATPEVTAKSPEVKQPASKLAWLHQAKKWYLTHKKVAIPLTVVTVLLLILAIPWTRYQSLGLALEKNFSIQVIDSTTKDPVSGALVSYGSISAQTDGDGVAKLKVKVGSHSFFAAKKYYKDGSISAVVPILSQKNIPKLELIATGRQVKVNIINTINKKPLGQVNIKVADITAKTDNSGNATLVLPPGASEQKAEIGLDGYVTANVVIKVSDSKVEENKFTLTSAGKIYFLSKRTGKIDVMKSNLDGSEQVVVFAGTGNEDESDTILLASRDWKYLVLKSKRDGGKNAKLFWIDTSTDKLNTLDEGDAEFTVIGWSENTFVYEVSRNSVAEWQPNKVALKSFDAKTAKLTILNQTGGVGNSSDNYRQEYMSNEFIIDDKIIFTKYWSGCCYSPDIGLLAGKQAGIYSINVNGSGFKTLKAFAYDDSNRYIYISGVLYKPKEIYYSVYTNDAYKYYEYDGEVKEDANLKDVYNKFVNSVYPTYLFSPSGEQTFWMTVRDGKNIVFVGDAEGNNEKEIAKLGEELNNYAYFTDDYMLFSKKSSELYIMSATGVKAEAELIKITDYHKPAYGYHGYGGH